MIKKTPRLIIPGSEGNPRTQAERYPYDPNLSNPINYPKPTIAGKNIVNTSRGPIRRTGATSTSAGAMGTSGGASTSMANSPLFYDYRWSTPDKYYFPRNRIVANSIWREIYKRDPAVAIATDMYSDLPWSKFDLTGIEDDSIRKLYEDMFNALNVVPKLQIFTREYLITGELILHLVFNSIKGYWERVISHDPDYVRVEGIGLATEQPLLWLRPTPEIKKLVSSNDPRIRKLQNAIPKELIMAFRMNKEVPLDPLNTTYIPRLNFSKDIRGMSLYTRLYRVIMYEDFIVNASLAVAQRNAAPLRIFKLGDPQTGWLPDADDEAAFAEMLSIAESDPLASIVMHHNVSCELVGVSDRVLLISKEWEFIERVKLLAMGVSKAFLIGETSFAASVAGLQTLLERLSALRSKIEQEWLIKKVMTPIAQINDFYKRPKSEIEHRLRIKTPDQMELLLPKIKWQKNLDPTQDVAILNIWRDLKERGLISERTYTTGAGLDIDVERKNIYEEKKFKDEHPEIYGIPQTQSAPGMAGAPKPGAPGAKPGAPAAPAAPGAPALGAPAPTAPRGHYRKKYGSDNPYIVEETLEEIRYSMESRANEDGMISVNKAMNAVEDSEAFQEAFKEALDTFQRNEPDPSFMSGFPTDYTYK
jgi:hypothetical protein